jgi:GNAT superfamily N-acetyltransferase
MLTQEEKIAAVERASVECAWTKPDTRLIEKPGWAQLVTPSSHLAVFNGVILSTLSAEDTERTMDEIDRFYQDQKKDYRWEISPSTRPADFEAILKKRGYAFDVEADGMVADLAEVSPAPPANKDIQVEEVGLDRAEEWARTSIRGWGKPESALAELITDVRRYMSESPRRVHYFMARHGTDPAGVGCVHRMHRNEAYLLGTSVRPEYRKAGAYRALVAHRLGFLRALGIPVAITQALWNTSAPICKRLGFEHVCKIRIYQTVRFSGGA